MAMSIGWVLIIIILYQDIIEVSFMLWQFLNLVSHFLNSFKRENYEEVLFIYFKDLDYWVDADTDSLC